MTRYSGVWAELTDLTLLTVDRGLYSLLYICVDIERNSPIFCCQTCQAVDRRLFCTREKMLLVAPERPTITDKLAGAGDTRISTADVMITAESH